MQYYINIFFIVIPGLFLLSFLIMAITLIVGRAKISKQVAINKEFAEYIACKDEVLEEFKKIRHEYNNILQTVTCLIEEELWDDLKEYKEILLQKTHLLHRNNLTQLVKINNKNILLMIYKLYLKAQEMGITLNLTIYNEIANDICPDNTELYHVLQDYLNFAYESAVKEAAEINFKISSNDMGICFCYESSFSKKLAMITSKPIHTMKNDYIGKKIFFNRYLKNENLIQEVLTIK